MSHWAKIDSNNIVVQVSKGPEEEPEAVTHQWLVDNVGGTWIQTSYNTHEGVHYGPDEKPDGGVALRKNYAGIGYSYDSVRDAFIPPKPMPIVIDGVSYDWTLNEETCSWATSAPNTVFG